MGPILILDKSAFQMLSHRELTCLRCHFLENLTPILAIEILGDLTKRLKKANKTPEAKVSEHATKFGGSGPAVCIHYRNACIANLLGGEVPMNGTIVVDYARQVRASDGTVGAFIDLHPLNEAILRWSEGRFSEVERLVSQSWRDTTRTPNYRTFREELDSRYVIVPKADSNGEIQKIVNTLLNEAGLQDVWFDWLIGQLDLPTRLGTEISAHWRSRSRSRLIDHAPYAGHCVRVQLSLHVAVRSGLIRWKPTNLLDLQYLYYLPFCMVFSSDDNLHKTLTPSLVRGDQDLVDAREPKADLVRIADYWETLPGPEKRKLGFALSGYPIPRRDSIVFRLWRKHMRPWSRDSCNRMTSLTADQQTDALREVEEMHEKAGYPVTPRTKTE